MLVLMRKVEVVIIGITKDQASNDEVEQRSRRTLVKVLGLVPAKDARRLGGGSVATGKGLVEADNVSHTLSVGGSTEVLDESSKSEMLINGSDISLN